ncbi:MAG TPA: hypothetical protein VEH04_09700 [Verrucomicrobiae bacterium]|nr:hypothetical protein [Verrucomicrobiae bacterium]
MNRDERVMLAGGSVRPTVCLAVTLIAMLACTFPAVHAGLLLRYDMSGAGPTFTAPGGIIQGQSLEPGSGVGTVSLPSQLAYPGAPVLSMSPSAGALPLNNAGTALTKDCCVSFDFIVGPMVGSLSVTGLTFQIARGGANSNRGFGVYVTTPFTADLQVQPSTLIDAQRFAWQLVDVNLLNVPELQNLRPGDAVRVRVPFWTAEAAQSVELDSIAVWGETTTATNPAATSPLRITELQAAADTISAKWNSIRGRSYAVEYSSNLAEWSSFPTNVPADPDSSETWFAFNTAFTNEGELVLLRYELGQRHPHTAVYQDGPGSDLTPGAGLALFDVNFSAYASAPSLQLNFKNTTPDIPTALSNESCFTFSFQTGSNVTDADLTSLSFNIARGGSSTPRGYAVYLTTPSTSNELVQLATAVNSVRPDWTPHYINLTGFSSLQNLSAGDTVVFKIVLYSPAAGSSLEFDDITLRGRVSPQPMPGYVGANSLFVKVRELPTPPLVVEAATKPTGAAWNPFSTRTLEQLPSFISSSKDGPASIYGGLLSRQTNATGYFYPLKVDNRWWLVDPQGYFFLHKGIAVISTINSPGAAAALADRFTNANNWAVSTTTQLRRHGFNGAGAWSDAARLRRSPGPLVYTIIKNFLGTYSDSSSNPGYPQVFDPEFVTFCESYAQSFANTKTDRWLLGYFSDNELAFPSSMLSTWLALPAGNSSHAEAWRWLRERYGPAATAGQVSNQDRLDFLGHVWGRYYQVVNQAIKQHDPNHLYLGSRFFSSDKDRPEIFRAIGPHVDVISVNHYNQWTPDISRIQMWEQESGRPVIITEYYVKGEDSGMPNNTGAGWVVRTQADRGSFYQNFTLALIESKVCVGWHWFKYADNDPDADADPSNIDSNKGVVSNRYASYEVLLNAMRALNERTYRIAEWLDGNLAP